MSPNDSMGLSTVQLVFHLYARHHFSQQIEDEYRSQLINREKLACMP